MQLTYLHLAGLLAVFAIVAAVGLRAARQVKTARDFVVGGRSMGPAVVSGAITGTIIGGASTIGTAQLAYTVGFSAWWFTLGAGIALIVLGIGYADSLRRAGVDTVSQYLAAHFGAVAAPLTSIAASLGIFFSIVANLLSAFPLLTAVFPITNGQAAGLALLIVLMLVFLGGLRGAGSIGLLKTALILVTVGIAGWQAFAGLGGWRGLITVFPAWPWFSLLGRGAWTDMASALSLVVGTLSTQTYIQAVCGAKDEQAARVGCLVAAAVTLPAGIPAVLVGMFMQIYHPNIEPLTALPMFIMLYLPPWLGGMALAGLLLAALGSAAGLTLGVGTTILQDVIRRWWRPQTEQAALNASRIMVLLIALGATSFTFGNLKSLVLEWNFLSMGLRGAGIFLPLTAAVFFPGRFSSRWSLLAMGVGAGVALFWKLLWPAGPDPLYGGLTACAVCLVVGWQEKKA